jgi:hypothetical protein
MAAGGPSLAAATDGSVRPEVITTSQRRLIAALTGRISDRLAAEFEKSPLPDSATVRVTLTERGKTGRVEIPCALLLKAEGDLTARDLLRVRIKAARDRMLFRPPPSRPRRDIEPLGDPAMWRSRGSFGRGGGRRRR